MAIALNTAVNGLSITSTSLTWNHTCTGSNMVLVVGVIIQSTSDFVTGVTYNGVAMTRATTAVTPSGPARRQYLYTLVAPATGSSLAIVVSLSSSINVGGMSVSYTGCAQTGQPDESNSNVVQAANSITASVASQATGSWIVGTVCPVFVGGTAYVVGSNTTQRITNVGGFDALNQMTDSNGATTVSQVFQWSTATDTALMCVSELIVAPASTANANFLMFM